MNIFSLFLTEFGSFEYEQAETIEEENFKLFQKKHLTC